MLPAESSMKSRYFDHIDLRVKDMERAKKFYVPVLAALGFTVDQSSKTWVTYAAPVIAGQPTEFFGFTHAPNHPTNGRRISFGAYSRAEVDRVADVGPERDARPVRR